MNTEHFKNEMERIARMFGSANYPIDRNRLIWSQVRDLPNFRFTKIVDHFIGNRSVQYPPMLKDFTEAAAEHRKIQFELDQREASQKIAAELERREKESPVSVTPLKKILEGNPELMSLRHAIRKGKSDS